MICVRTTRSAAWVDNDTVQVAHGIADERVAETFSEAVQLASELAAGVHGEGPWFGGLAFPNGSQWAGFPAARFIRPLEVTSMPRERVAQLADVLLPRSVMTPAWAELVTRATEAIAAGTVEKVVVARQLELSAEQPIDGWELFRALCVSPAARHFFFRAENGACFTGASPETLVRWRDRRVEVDALAGTVPAGGTFSDKERREHDFVVRDVAEALGVEAPREPSVMKLPALWHLHTRVTGPASEGFDFGALLRRLFPTSAVAGAPRAAALDFLARHEGLERGWYAGAVGRIAPGDVDLAVALRCAWVHGRTARLFAGAGIVAGSRPEAEWDETARKLVPAARALEEVSHARA
jgi:salicylate biosynthesis isochorismate synthase/menaquinone-specific isochorismate synthase